MVEAFGRTAQCHIGAKHAQTYVQNEDHQESLDVLAKMRNDIQSFDNAASSSRMFLDVDIGHNWLANMISAHVNGRCEWPSARCARSRC